MLAARTASIFIVIGPAVNEVSRILAMSRSVEQDVAGSTWAGRN
jgi:hypothetical protein